MAGLCLLEEGPKAGASCLSLMNPATSSRSCWRQAAQSRLHGMITHNGQRIASPATFTKDERLKSSKRIAQLFKKGKVRNLPPLRMVYLACESLPRHQVLFAVSSKKIRSAVTRNKLKRRMREAYRLNKHLLLPSPKTYFLIGYSYIGAGQLCDFKTIQEKLIASLQYLNHLDTKNNYAPLQA